jgi:hypothetical protein
MARPPIADGTVLKRVEFISDKMSCRTLKGHCFNVVLNVYTLTVDKSDNTMDNFYKELSSRSTT